MFCRIIQRAVLVGVACAAVVDPAPAAAVGENALTPALSHPMGEGALPSQRQYRITHWTAENGLPQNSIKALAQTRDGYLWVGTLKGLARFDGVRFRVFDHNNVPEMTHDSINDLAVDAADGGLWIGTGEGLLYYRGHQFARYGMEQGIQGPVGHVCAARSEGAWFSPSRGKVGLARAGSVHLREFGPDVSENAVRQLGEATPDQLLAMLDRSHSFCRIELTANSVVPLKVAHTNYYCSSFFQDTDGSVWLCRNDGVWHGTEVAWTRVASADEHLGPWPNRVFRARDGQVWVTQTEGERGSLQTLVDGRLERFEAPEFPAGLRATLLLEDQEGNLWVGSTTGLFRLEPKRLRVYSCRDGLRNDATQAVAEGTDGTIWVGTDRGVNGIREGKVLDLPSPEDGQGWEGVSALLVDRQKALWVGWHQDVLARFAEGRWQRFPGPPHLGYLKAIYEDRNRRMWIGVGGGVVCRDGLQQTYFTTTNGLSHDDVRLIYQDRRGDVWFGTFGGGLNRLHDGKFTIYKTTRSEHNNRMWWIHEDADGVFWVGTEDGLNRFVPPGAGESRKQKAESRNGRAPAARSEDAGRFFTFTTEQGLGENVVNNIQEDEFGCLWLSGLHGIYRVPRQRLNEVAAGLRATVECIAYGEADGMLNSECNGGDNQPAGCKDRHGRIWFPTAQGVVVIDPKEMQRAEAPLPVVIEQVRANREVVFGDGCRGSSPKSDPLRRRDSAARVRSLKAEDRGASAPNIEHRTSNIQPRTQLKPGHARVVEIHYTANSLTAPERVVFKYRLEGYDRDWLWDDQNRRVAFYTNLRPGNYTFQVIARGPHGAWNTRGDQFSFHVAPHFYETWAFYGASGAVLLLAGLGLHYRRVRGLQRVQLLEQQRSLQEERARIAKDLHDDLGANLTGLALQLDVVGARSHSAEAQQGQLAALARNTRGLVDNMREVVWAMNPQHDNLESLAGFLGQYTEQFLAAAGLRCRLELPDGAPAHPVDSQTRHQLFLVLKEALHNVVRHARASEVRLRLEQERQELRMALEDNGCGLPAESARITGHGLEGMQKRVTDLGGEFSATVRADGGTRIEVRLPLTTAKQRK
jgi:signal transduction histidine kinase/ligand-binding sensor domain-containing protein